VKRYKDDKDEIFPLSLIFFRLNFAWGYLGAESYFGCLALLQNLDRYKILFLAFLKLHEMSSERTFDSATSLTVCEEYDVTNQGDCFKKRCSCCECFRRGSTFRVSWHVLLFLFMIVIIIAGLVLVIGMLATGKIATKRSSGARGTDSPDDPGKHFHLFRS